MRRSSSFLGTLAAFALTAAPALANTETITAYDARSGGMGHTGTSFIASPAAILLNPANLTDVQRLELTVNFLPDFTNAVVPYLGATGVSSAKSNFLVTPLGMVGLGYKLHPGVSVGLSGQLTQVKGVDFQHTPLSLVQPFNADGTPNATAAATPGRITAAQLAWEVRAPVAVDVTKWLTVSAGYRMMFFHQGVKIKADALPVDSRNDSYNGHNFAGAQAGLLFKLPNHVRLGLSYRSKMVMFGSGTAKALNPANGQVVQTQVKRGARYASPHMFTAGLSTHLLDHRLTLAIDYRYWMYKDAYAGMGDYRDAMSGHIGAEYMVTPRVPLRAGYVLGLSAVRPRSASPVDTTPGLQNGGTLGSGYHFTNVDVDAAVGYGGSSTTVGVTPSAVPGHYRLNAILVNLSATVHL